MITDAIRRRCPSSQVRAAWRTRSALLGENEHQQDGEAEREQRHEREEEPGRDIAGPRRVELGDRLERERDETAGVRDVAPAAKTAIHGDEATELIFSTMPFVVFSPIGGSPGAGDVDEQRDAGDEVEDGDPCFRSPPEDGAARSVRTVPIYEYVCMECESHFEELVRGEEQVACPDCAATNVSRQFSTFAVHGAAKVTTGGGGGGCCGGSCGCGH